MKVREALPWISSISSSFISETSKIEDSAVRAKSPVIASKAKQSRLRGQTRQVPRALREPRALKVPFSMA
jgi:hypothetical protein